MSKTSTHKMALINLNYLKPRNTVMEFNEIVEYQKGYIKQQEQQEKEFEEYKKSDASKEQSSINYYNELKELKKDVKRFFELSLQNINGDYKLLDERDELYAKIKSRVNYE